MPPVPTPPKRRLDADQARRLVLAGQGFETSRPVGTGVAALRGLLQRLGAVQIDSINIVARSHEIVLAARTGVDSGAAFSQAVYRRRIGFEYWGHAASFMPIESFRLFLPRMQHFRGGSKTWFTKNREANGPAYDLVLGRIRDEGPLPASAFREPGAARRGSWWDWTPAKGALEDLHAQGVLLVHDRVNFERRYDLAERVLPLGVDLRVPSPHEAAVELIQIAARALGAGTEADLRDYFRLSAREGRAAIVELVTSRLLEPVAVEGWPEVAYIAANARIPRRTDFPPTLLSPFDSLIWASASGARERTSRVFGFDYKLEIYIPSAQRTHGYYTTPVLADGRLIARVDPKLDRANRRLLLRAVHIEPGVDPESGRAAVIEAAQRLAGALGAAELVISDAMA